LEHAGIDEPAHPAEAAARIRVVVEAADRCEAPAAAEVPLLDLFVPIFDVGAEAVEIVAKPLLDRAQPCLLRVVAGVDTALIEEVVFDLLEDQRVEVAPRLAPIRCLAASPTSSIANPASRARANTEAGAPAMSLSWSSVCSSSWSGSDSASA